MSRRQTGAGTIAALALTCVFGATLLLSLATGAGVYRRVADRVERSAGDRVGLTYITAKIHSFDETGMVSSGTLASDQPGGGEARAVCLCQEIDGTVYQTALYVYDGYLRELMCEKEWPLGPEAGLPITEAQALLIEEPEPGLLCLVYTGADGTTSTADVYLRSGG